MASVSVRRGGSVRDVTAALVDSSGGVIPIASEFLSYVSLRGCSPNTVLAYAYDLAHLWRFFEASGLSWDQLTPQRSPELLVYFRALPSNRRDGAAGPVLATSGGEPVEPRRLSPGTINRALAAVSAFYDWAVLWGRFGGPNPIARITDRSIMMVSDRHRPFLAGMPRCRPQPGRSGSEHHAGCRDHLIPSRSRGCCWSCAPGVILPWCV
jgi:integrase/recombinase XerD